MQTDIYYRDITRTDNLENFLLDKVEGTIGDYFKYDPSAHVTVRVDTERHRTAARKPRYMCEVIVKSSRSRSIVKVRKTDENFQVCVNSTVNALRNALSRKFSRHSDHGRRDPMLALRSNYEYEEEEGDSLSMNR